MRQRTLEKLIARDRGTPERDQYSTYMLPAPHVLVETARKFLAHIPPTFGACAMLSAGWAAFLRDNHNIPAIAVAGDLKVRGTKVFKCKENLPQPGQTGKVISRTWDGHCWLEVGGYVGDLSIFRTAYAIQQPSILKEFILEKFGYGRGALLCPERELHTLGMAYEPKYVLNENQINGLVAGLRAQITNGI